MVTGDNPFVQVLSNDNILKIPDFIGLLRKILMHGDSSRKRFGDSSTDRTV
jgi:hypothetical protein